MSDSRRSPIQRYRMVGRASRYQLVQPSKFLVLDRATLASRAVWTLEAHLGHEQARIAATTARVLSFMALGDPHSDIVCGWGSVHTLGGVHRSARAHGGSRPRALRTFVMVQPD